MPWQATSSLYAGPWTGTERRLMPPRVLIVEDEADLAWVEQFNLETEGYEVLVAPEGRSAIEALSSFDPDVLVLDVMLPYVDGWQVLARMREMPSARRPKVIMVSAAA